MSRHFRAGEILVDDLTDAYTFEIEFQERRADVLPDTPLIRARVLVPVMPGETDAAPARERARLLQQALRRIL